MLKNSILSFLTPHHMIRKKALSRLRSPPYHRVVLLTGGFIGDDGTYLQALSFIKPHRTLVFLIYVKAQHVLFGFYVIQQELTYAA